ncbi:hypothetical protein SpCBS45565_g00759 [Spizellomyces sp. 'palustris']|nr:hypothetical protein SpCBS45565_g00759 [Spizellomyces sp. 'palustris']
MAIVELCGLLVATGLTFVIFDYLFNHKNATIPFASGHIPVLGHLANVRKYVEQGKAHQFFIDLNKKYGPIVRFRFLSEHSIVISDPTAAKVVLSDSTSFPRGNKGHVVAEGMFYNGLFIMPTDEVWKMHRKLLQPGFGPTHLRHAVTAASAVGDELLQLWDTIYDNAQKAGGEARAIINAHLYMSCATLDVLGQVAFSYTFGHVRSLKSHDVEAQALFRAYEVINHALTRRALLPRILWNLAKVGPNDIKSGTAAVLDAVNAIVDSRKKRSDAFQASDTSADFLDRLLSSGKLSDQDILDELVAFFIAGFETTSNTLTTAMMCLAQHPDAMKMIQEEVDSVLGSSLDVNSDDMSRLVVTDAIVKETLRLYPTIPVLRRSCVKESTLVSHKVARGTVVYININSIHHDPQSYPDPQSFQPSRWLKADPAPPGSFIPFGLGVHNCIGQKMALNETKTLLVKLAARYTWKIVPGQALRIVYSVTAGLKDGLFLELEKRSV